MNFFPFFLVRLRTTQVLVPGDGTSLPQICILYFSYLWANFAKIEHEWSSHQWEMTDTVENMITHIFRPSHDLIPPHSPKSELFLFMG